MILAFPQIRQLLLLLDELPLGGDSLVLGLEKPPQRYLGRLDLHGCGRDDGLQFLYSGLEAMDLDGPAVNVTRLRLYSTRRRGHVRARIANTHRHITRRHVSPMTRQGYRRRSSSCSLILPVAKVAKDSHETWPFFRRMSFLYF